MDTITPASVIDDAAIRERLIGDDKHARSEVYHRHSGIVLGLAHKHSQPRAGRR